MTDEDKWAPLGMDPEPLEALTDGVPPWLHHSLWAWIEVNVSPSPYGRTEDLVAQYDRRTRRRVPLYPGFYRRGLGSLQDELSEDETIRFVDFLLAHGLSLNIAGLRELLLDGGSLWALGERSGRRGLVRRVPEGVQRAAEEAMSAPGHAGPLLAEAWGSTFGVGPDYERAYSKSVKAVEAASIPVVMPTNRSAGLQNVIGQMRADGDWGLAMSREHSLNTSAATVLAMMQVLWTGQNDRHAGQPGYSPSTAADGEAAVLLAVPLVQWFTSGAIARR
ncbi:hypothetical protein SAMN06295885_0463 [Rathayibacter oskolensis]|uniref:Uncharacterized protein n=1 Tax=Rathayibacter oskolensis TaxID=1891671 RepID=A0A1X7N0E3_9MICO|nr:hypothetical protein [Rathayibacter oskolensis]SMH30679.1 hypothetical protein SAMN06295885_0463 [Rathayibacter oskolensis]